MSGLSMKTFWFDALERAVKTVAQTALSLLTVNGADLFTMTTRGFWSTTALSGLISLLMSVISSGVGKDNSASLVVETKELK
jgi:hypothetical protein